MNNENAKVNAETDTGKTNVNTLLAYAEAAVIADLFKGSTQSKDAERSVK